MNPLVSSSIHASKWKRRQVTLPKVAAVVINYNTADLTRRSIEALLQSRNVELEIFIIDNGSVDSTATSLARKFKLRKNNAMLDRVARVNDAQSKDFPLFSNIPSDAQSVSNIRSGKQEGHTVHLVELSDNVGFGRANNFGAWLADEETEYFAFVNSDAFVERTTMKTLVQAFKSNTSPKKSAVLRRKQHVLDTIGIAAAQLYNEDGTLQVQGGQLPTHHNIFNWIFFVDDLPFWPHVFGSYQHHDEEMKMTAKEKRTKVGWVGGTVMMISRPCVEEIGGFDPQLFMYGEDVELCWRATKKHWDVALVKAGKVTHLGSASSSSHRAIIGEINGLLYLWYKHGSPFDYWLMKQILRWGIRLRVLIFGILRRYGKQRTYQEALALVR